MTQPGGLSVGSRAPKPQRHAATDRDRPFPGRHLARRHARRRSATRATSRSRPSSTTGRVEAVRRGEAAALVRYEGQYAVAPITVIGTRDGYAWKESPEFNFVDTHVNAKLRKMKLWASDLCSDSEFLRRISLDLTGRAPEHRPDAGLRRRSARLARRSATRRPRSCCRAPPSSITGPSSGATCSSTSESTCRRKGVWAFRNWIRQAIAQNKPYDKFVSELMTASGRSLENPAANYYRIAREPNVVMENMTQVFLGIRFNCNKCHDHPFERWTQQQYYELSAYFSAVGRAPGATADDEIVYTLPAPEAVINPRTNTAVKAVFPFTYTGMKVSSDDRRDRIGRMAHLEGQPVLRQEPRQPVLELFPRPGNYRPGRRYPCGQSAVECRAARRAHGRLYRSRFRPEAPDSHDHRVAHVSAQLSDERLEHRRPGQLLARVSAAADGRRAVRCDHGGDRISVRDSRRSSRLPGRSASRSADRRELSRHVRPSAARSALRMRADDRREPGPDAQPDQRPDDRQRDRQSARTDRPPHRRRREAEGAGAGRLSLRPLPVLRRRTKRNGPTPTWPR